MPDYCTCEARLKFDVTVEIENNLGGKRYEEIVDEVDLVERRF